MPPVEQNREGRHLWAACERLGLHPFPIPMLRNSVPYNGRAGCIRNRTCVGGACPVDAKNGTQNTVIPDGFLAVGSPAKVKRQVTPEEIEANRENALLYIREAKEYREYLEAGKR